MRCCRARSAASSRVVPEGQWRGCSAGGCLLAPPGAALQGAARRRQLVCGYHGLKYNAQGRCTFMPSQETINPSACVRAYPVVERHRFVWLWPGDPALADPALVPGHALERRPGWAGDGKTIHVKCDYRLVVDNLMDLTHETFVHGSSIGNRRGRRSAVRRHPWREDGDGDALDEGHRAAAVLGRAVAQARSASIAGRSSVSRRRARSISTSASRPAGTGAPEGDRSQGVNGYVLNTDHAGDREDLPLFLGVRAQLPPGPSSA